MFCRFILPFSPLFVFFFNRSFRNSSSKRKIGHGETRCVAVLCGFDGVFAFFVPEWKQPNVSCETFGCFLLSCFLPLFFLSFSPAFCSLSFHPSFFTFSCLIALPGVFCLLLHAFSGRFLPLFTSRVIFGRVFLDLGVVFAPFFFFSRSLFYISFGIFAVFGLILRFCRGGSAVFFPSFCSFSLFPFMFLPCFFVFCCSRVIFGGVFLFFFRFFVLFIVSRVLLSLFCALFWVVFCLFALLG